MTLRQYDIIKDDVNFERKLDEITEGQAGGRKYIKDHLLHRITRENCLIIVSYILAMQVEINPRERYRLDTIARLKQLAEFHNPKSFKDMTRQDILDYLERFRKSESADPLHKWIGTRNNTLTTFIRFFRWLYNSDISPSKARPIPPLVRDIPPINRKEQSIYKATDLWTQQDDVLFYKYCPSKRDRCYHAVARDTGCRPDELLKLKIKDLVISVEDGMHIARIQVNGKTGTRSVRVSNAYPYLKDWLSNGHPYGSTNPNAPLFCGIGKKTFGKRLKNSNAIYLMYLHYKKDIFPQLLEEEADGDVSEEDKHRIRELLNKPWNPHLRRHTSATENSKIIKDDWLLDDYYGWSHKGNTRNKYRHYFEDDAVNAVLTLADGLNLSKTPGTDGGKNPLKPIRCPNCDETNKPEAKFCAKCKFVLSFDAFNEAIEDRDKTRSEFEAMKAEHKRIVEEMKKQIEDARWISSRLKTNAWQFLKGEELERRIKDGTLFL